MSNPFNLGIFSAPRFSSFPWSHGNRISMDAGKIHVIGSEYLDTGEKFDLNSIGNITRVAPMKAPTLDTYRTDIHAFAVRLRTIGMVSRNPWEYEDFFNLNVNVDGSYRLPMVPLALLIGYNKCRNNTLFENFGLPTFKQLRENYLQFLRSKCPWVFDSVATKIVNPIFHIVGFQPVSFLENSSRDYNSYPFRSGNYYYSVTSYDSNSYDFPYIKTLINYLYDKYGSLKSFMDSQVQDIVDVDDISLEIPDGVLYDFSGSSSVPAQQPSTFNVLDKLFELEKVDAISVMKEFEDYLCDTLWSLSDDGIVSFSYLDGRSDLVNYGFSHVVGFNENSLGFSIILNLKNEFPDLPTQNLLFCQETVAAGGGSYAVVSPMIPTYFFDSYHKIIGDWYINTALIDPDVYFHDKFVPMHPGLLSSLSANVSWSQLFSGAVGTYSSGGLYLWFNAWVDVYSPAHDDGFAMRYYGNDYFTSCFPSPQAGQAVGIPINGTIVDLRNANAMQKLKERLLYAGKRFRDVLYALTGKRTSSAIMDMSEVIGAWSNTINVDSVLQQSETTNSQPLANYAGTGLGYRSGGKGAYYLAEEPTVIIFVASIVPKASYFQGLHRKFMRSNVYDYDIPQLANVGEEIVRRGELYLDGDNYASSPDVSIFGYTRRNGSFMWANDEVHGDFRGNLDFWHNARIFGSVPSLTLNFMKVRPDDDNLNRIFAVTSDSVNHFYAHFTFIGNVIRHLPKHVHYDL